MSRDSPEINIQDLPSLNYKLKPTNILKREIRERSYSKEKPVMFTDVKRLTDIKMQKAKQNR
jgi:hypothetical protein